MSDHNLTWVPAPGYGGWTCSCGTLRTGTRMAQAEHTANQRLGLPDPQKNGRTSIWTEEMSPSAESIERMREQLLRVGQRAERAASTARVFGEQTAAANNEFLRALWGTPSYHASGTATEMSEPDPFAWAEDSEVPDPVLPPIRVRRGGIQWGDALRGDQRRLEEDRQRPAENRIVNPDISTTEGIQANWVSYFDGTSIHAELLDEMEDFS